MKTSMELTATLLFIEDWIEDAEQRITNLLRLETRAEQLEERVKRLEEEGKTPSRETRAEQLEERVKRLEEEGKTPSRKKGTVILSGHRGRVFSVLH